MSVGERGATRIEANTVVAREVSPFDRSRWRSNTEKVDDDDGEVRLHRLAKPLIINRLRMGVHKGIINEPLSVGRRR